MTTESMKYLLETPFEGHIVSQVDDPNSKYTDFDGNPIILYPWSDKGLQHAVKLRERLGKKGFLRSGLSSSGDDRRSAEGGLVVDLSYFSNIQVAESLNADDCLPVTADAAVRNSQLARALVQANAFLPIGDNQVKSVVSSLLSDQPGYFGRSMGHLRNYVNELHVITPQGEVRSVSKDATDFASVLDGSFGGVIKAISFSAVPPSREVVHVVRASSIYTHENFAAALDLLNHPDISDTMDVSVHTYHTAYSLLIISVTIAGRPEDDDSINTAIDAIMEHWTERHFERQGQFAQQTERMIRRVEAKTPAQITELILEGGIDDNPYLDRNLTCKHYNQEILLAEFDLSSFMDGLIDAFGIGGTANPPEVIGSLRLSLSHDEMLMINADIFLPRELTAVEIEFASFVSQRLGEPIQSAPLTAEQTRLREVEVPDFDISVLRSVVSPLHPLKTLGFEGNVYVPGTNDYEIKRKQYALSSYPDKDQPGGSMYPHLIAYPKPDTNDIAIAIKFAIDNEKYIVTRSGGHQYSGLSSGGEDTILLSMDLYSDDIDFKEVDNKIYATLGVGNRLTDIAEKFRHKGVTIPHGECPGVGIGGHVQTGGYGHILRSYGLALDHVNEFSIVMNNGETKTVKRPKTRDKNSLYWAVLGGGPGSFGVLTRITFECIRDDEHQKSWGSAEAYIYSKKLFLGAMKEIKLWTEQISGEAASIPPDVDMCVTLYTPSVLGLSQTVLILEMVNGNKDNDDGMDNRRYLMGARRRILNNRQFRNLKIPFYGYRAGNHDLSFLSNKKVRREMGGGGREYKEPYLKRLNCTKEVISDAFIERFVELIDHVVQSKTVKLVFQMFLGGGAYALPNSDSPLNSICHRDVTFGIVFDCFYIGKRGLNNAKKFQKEMQDLLEEFSGNQEIRMLWGSFGDTNISDEKIRKLYYDDDTWRSLQKVKESVDKEDLFHTEFTVQVPSHDGTT